MDKSYFTLTLKDDVIRTMTREQYYEQKRYLRLMTKIIAKNIDKEKIEKSRYDMAIYGVSTLIL